METINSMVKHGNEISVISARFWTAARTRTHSCKCGGGSGYEVFSNLLALSWEHNFSVKLSQRLQWWQTLEVPHWASFKVARSKCTDDGESTRWGCCEGRGNLREPSSEHSGFFLRWPHHTMTMLICAFGPLLPFSISSHSWHCGSADTSLRKMPNEETSLKHFLLGFFFFFASTSPPPPLIISICSVILASVEARWGAANDVMSKGYGSHQSGTHARTHSGWGNGLTTPKWAILQTAIISARLPIQPPTPSTHPTLFFACLRKYMHILTFGRCKICVDSRPCSF